MGQTFVEKIFSRKMGKKVVPGEIVEVEPDVAMSHDNTSAISGSPYPVRIVSKLCSLIRPMAGTKSAGMSPSFRECT